MFAGFIINKRLLKTTTSTTKYSVERPFRVSISLAIITFFLQCPAAEEQQNAGEEHIIRVRKAQSEPEEVEGEGTY